MLRAISNTMFLLAVVLIAGALGLVIAGLQMTGQAVAVNSVSMGDNFFAPQSVSIAAGEAIEWRNGGNLPHTSTSDSGLWDSSLLKKGQTFSQVFSAAGTFTYKCDVHPEMTGTVSVAAAAQPTSAPQPISAPLPTTASAASGPPAAATTDTGQVTNLPNGGGPPLPQRDMFTGALLLAVTGVALALCGAVLMFAGFKADARTG